MTDILLTNQIETTAPDVKQTIDLDDEHENLRQIISYIDANDESKHDDYSVDETTASVGVKHTARHRNRVFRPIIMMFIALLMFSAQVISAQVVGSVQLIGEYSDNCFQLSDYDLQRCEDGNPDFAYVNTTDDFTCGAKVNIAYPFSYHWWKFEPSIQATMLQNVMNTDKLKRDLLTRLHVERYYWNATAAYGYYPYNYLRNYMDTDGTGQSEKFSYSKNMYRADVQFKPIRKTTLKLNYRHEDYYYNQYWTEFDGSSDTYGIGIRQQLPVVLLDGAYYYRVFNTDSSEVDNFEDASYESNMYSCLIQLNKMPLNSSSKKGVSLRPSLNLSYEKRYYQGGDTYHRNRQDDIYNTSAAFKLFLTKKVNINLDYSHTFRNVGSPYQSVIRAKEYFENSFGTTVEYIF